MTPYLITSEGFVRQTALYVVSLICCFPPVKAIIEHEAKNGIPPHRIILGGFSQVGLHILVLYSTRVIFVTQYFKKCKLMQCNKLLFLCPSSSGWGIVLVYRLDLPASVGWCCGPQLLATTSQQFPIGTVTVLLGRSYLVLLPPQFKLGLLYFSD